MYDRLGIASLVELEYACLENRLKELKGFGEKSQAAILKELLVFKRYLGLVHLRTGLSTMHLMVQHGSVRT